MKPQNQEEALKTGMKSLRVNKAKKKQRSRLERIALFIHIIYVGIRSMQLHILECNLK